MDQPGAGSLAGFRVPAHFQHFLSTWETLLSDLEDCLFLSRDYDGRISLTVSDSPPNVHFSEDDLSLQGLTAIFADCEIVALPTSSAL